MGRFHPHALTCAALLAATGAAQAQSGPRDSVTVYGIVDACVARSDLGAETRNVMNSGCQSGSRLGFRGTEDLGGGLRAGFNIESGLTIDTGQVAQGGRMWGRKALVSLGGRFGSFEAGRDYGPAFYIVQPVDPMGLGIGTASSSIWTGAAATSAGRNDNAINYLSPVWKGLSLRLQVTAGENSTTSPKSKGFNVLYRDGKTIAGLAHARISNVAGNAEDRATTVAVRHDFGAFALAAIVQSGGWEGSRSAASPASATSVFSRDYRSYLLGGTVRAGTAGSVNVSFKRYDDRTARNFDLDQFSVNYLHSLSKRTTLYAAWSRLDNKRASSYAVSDATTSYSGVTAGSATTLLAAGIRHLF